MVVEVVVILGFLDDHELLDETNNLLDFVVDRRFRRKEIDLLRCEQLVSVQVRRVRQLYVREQLAADSSVDTVNWEPAFAALVLTLEEEWADIDMNEPDEVLGACLFDSDF